MSEQLRGPLSMKKEWRITSTSDLHKGQNRVNAHQLAKSYRELFFPYIEKSDILFVVGDYFDKAITLSDPRSDEVMGFTNDLLYKLDEYNVTARFLRGTFSHDRTQLNHISSNHKTFRLKNDLKVIDEIALEELPNGMRILYIPDDLQLSYGNSDAVLDYVWSLMHPKGWDYVDYALVHGSFDFAGFTEHTKPRICFRVDQFRFVRRRVLVGHIHTPYAKEHVLYHGSPDRSAHNEEEDKGFLYITDRYPESVSAEFVVNQQSTWFKTYRDGDIDVSEILKLWQVRFDQRPMDRLSFFRLIHPDPGIRFAVEKLARGCPLVVFTAISPKEQKAIETQDVGPLGATSFTPYRVPTPETLPDDILNYLQEKGVVSTLTKEKINHYLSHK